MPHFRSQINPDTILKLAAIQIATLQTGKAHQGLQGGYLRCSEPEDSTRVDLKPKMKKIDLDGALLWLGFGRSCVFLVVAISAVSWFSCQSGVLQRSAGWLSEVQRA